MGDWLWCTPTAVAVFCVPRDIQLVGELLHPHGWSGLGGEPDRLGGEGRPGDCAAPGGGALPQRLDVPVRQRSLCGRRGRLPWRLALGVCCLVKHRCIVDEASRLLPLLELYLTRAESACCTVWRNTLYLYWRFLTGCLVFVYNCVSFLLFLYFVSRRVIFILCIVLTQVKVQGGPRFV